MDESRIVRVVGANWEAIYSNGNLIIQGPRLNARIVLEAFGYQVTTRLTDRSEPLPEKLDVL